MRNLHPRTQNAAELEIAKELEDSGYEVIKNGWPDFVAVRGDEVRFIEVKPKRNGRVPRLSPRQQRMAAILKKVGITIELVTPD